MKLSFTLLILLFYFNLSFSQTSTQNVYGEVVDSENGLPLYGASVVIKNSGVTIGAISDFDGQYFIENVPIGLLEIQISYIGYETVYLNNIRLGSGKALQLDFPLKEALTEIGEITVVAQKKKSTALQSKNEMATVSALTLDVKQSERFPGGLNDPSRLVLSFPGVRNQGDIQNGISIRGNTPSSLLWSYEGLELQSPNHFAREGNLGAVNMVSSKVLSEVDFFTAAFPAQYGNAGSGVFDLKVRNGNSNEYEFSLSAGVMGLEASAEGPLSKKYNGSFLFTYRYSTLAIFNNLGIDITNNSSPNYQDVNYILNLPSKKAGNFRIFGFFGDSYIQPFDESLEISDFQDKYRLATLVLENKYHFNKKTSLQSALAYSQSRGYYWDEYISESSRNDTIKKDVYRNDFPIYDRRLQLDLKLNTKVSAAHSFKLGLNVAYYNFNQKFKNKREFQTINAQNNQLLQNNITGDSVVSKASTFQIKAYMQHKIRLTERLDFIAGLHFINFNYTKFFSVEPRLGLAYHNYKYKMNLGFGIHSRVEPLGFYGQEKSYELFNSQTFTTKDTTIQFNKFLEATKSIHLVLGNEVTIAPRLKLKAEVYFQYLYNIPVLKVLDGNVNLQHGYFSSINFQYPSVYDYNLLQPIQFDNKGVGLNYGVDLTLEKAFHKNYYVLINASLYESKYKTPYTKELFDVNWLNTKYNGKFLLSATAGKDFKIGKDKNNVFSLNLKTTWAGNNKTYTIEEVKNNETPYINSLNNYFKIDTRVAYTRNKKKYAWTLSLDILNATNRINENNNPEVNTVTGILPVLNYRVEF